MRKPWQVGRYIRLAETLLREKRLGDLGRDADDKLAVASRVGTQIQKIREDLSTLVQLLVAYAKGEYRDVPRSSLLLISAGVLYFVTPLDVIPDFLVGVGYLDDLTVLTYVIGIVREEIERFRSRPILSTAESVYESDERLVSPRSELLTGTQSSES